MLSSFQPIEKETLVETDSNVTPKETDYVRINMVVKSEVRFRHTNTAPNIGEAIEKIGERDGGTAVKQCLGLRP